MTSDGVSWACIMRRHHIRELNSTVSLREELSGSARQRLRAWTHKDKDGNMVGIVRVPFLAQDGQGRRKTHMAAKSNRHLQYMKNTQSLLSCGGENLLNNTVFSLYKNDQHKR